MTRCEICCAVALVLVCLGCSPGDTLGRKAMSGRVTVDGAPVPNGSIEFSPMSPNGVSSGAVIRSGSYSIESKDGLPPGKYRVSIRGTEGNNFKASPGKMPGDEEMPATKELVPSDWNADGKHNIEVKGEGSNVFNFSIETKGEGAKAESPKADASKADGTKTDASKADSAKPDAGKAEAPK